MIEIIVVFRLASWARNQARAKGHAGGKYAALMVALWFLGEITGLVIGSFVFYDSLMTYALALAGAAAGAGIAAAIIRDLTPAEQPIPGTPGIRIQAGSECPRCGKAARAGDRFCRQCGADLETQAGGDHEEAPAGVPPASNG